MTAGSALAVFGTALRQAADGDCVRLVATDLDGRRRAFTPGAWCGRQIPGDLGLLRRCAGPALDVGCGPGRLARALSLQGHAALGIDICRDAVRLARRRGAVALRRDVFGRLPGEGRWRRVLLADGNIGIAGDPVRLLRRCRELATPDGRILVEVDPPGVPAWSGPVRIAVDGGEPSAPFPWAYVGVDDLARLAGEAGLRVLEGWTEAGRWFASLNRN